MAVLVFLAGGRSIMMGDKARNFTPLSNLSLEELVPKDNFYRRLEVTLDTTGYAPTGELSLTRRRP
jgi:hypothetical protein